MKSQKLLISTWATSQDSIRARRASSGLLLSVPPGGKLMRIVFKSKQTSFSENNTKSMFVLECMKISKVLYFSTEKITLQALSLTVTQVSQFLLCCWKIYTNWRCFRQCYYFLLTSSRLLFVSVWKTHKIIGDVGMSVSLEVSWLVYYMIDM